MTHESLDMLGGRVHAEVVRGDLRAVPEAIQALRQGQAHAWADAVAAAGSVLRPGKLTPPTLDELRAHMAAGAANAVPVSLACADLARVEVLRGDTAALGRTVALQAELAAALPDKTHELALRIAEGWYRLLTGAHDGIDASLEATQREAQAEKLAGIVIDAATLRSHVMTVLAQDDEAKALARRATLMARAEGLPAQEFSAYLALGRARRRTGAPHLATLILRSLTRVATRHWHPWIVWERIFAGDEDAPAAASSLQDTWTPAGRAASSLAAVIRAASAGAREPFDRAMGELEHACAAQPLLRDDVAALRATVDPGAPLPESGPVRAWCLGSRAEAPPELCGLLDAAPPEEEAQHPCASVLVTPGASGRRLLALGVPLIDRADLVRVRRSRRKQGRVETLLAVLATAPNGGLPDAACFEAAYDLAFTEALHRGVFEVLLHRSRAELGDGATIAREGGKVSLEVSTPLLVPDPRTGAGAAARILRLLARRGRATAQEAAQEMGISVRTAQAALKELADDGACRAAPGGRKLEYAVEDTTFSDPTERLALAPEFADPATDGGAGSPRRA